MLTRLGLYGGPRTPYAGFSAAVTAAVSGTIGDGATEDDIRDTGGTVIIELANDTWQPAGGSFDGIRQDIIDGLDAAASPAAGWNTLVRDVLDVSAVARTSNTVVTITVPATAGYDIDANETITATVPASALVTSSSPVIATPAFTVTFVEPPAPVGDAMADPREPGRERRRGPHPAWRAMVERLRREAEAERQRLEAGTATETAEIPAGDRGNYLQDLAARRTALDDDIDAIEQRIEALGQVDGDNVVMLEAEQDIDQAREEAAFFLSMAERRRARLALLTAAIEAVVQTYYL